MNKFIKKHKSTIIGIAVFIVVLIGLFAIRGLVSPSENKAIYGSRLKDKVELTANVADDVKSKVEASSNKTTVRVAGRIINIIIDAKEGTTLEQAKELGNKVLEAYTKEELAYYDVQVFITNEKDTEKFPIIGYKHHTKDTITWTKDRG